MHGSVEQRASLEIESCKQIPVYSEADGAEKSIASKLPVLSICLDIEIVLFGPRNLCFAHIMHCCSGIIGP